MCSYVSVWRIAISSIRCSYNSRSCVLFLFKNCILLHIQRICGSPADIDTRRRAACDLVRGLCKFFEGPVTGIFSGYVNSMLQEYAKNPSVNWKHKDAAIYLVTSLASKAQTQKVFLHSICLIPVYSNIGVYMGTAIHFMLFRNGSNCICSNLMLRRLKVIHYIILSVGNLVVTNIQIDWESHTACDHLAGFISMSEAAGQRNRINLGLEPQSF